MKSWSASPARIGAPTAASPGSGDEDTAFLLNQPAGRAERRRALAVLLASLLLFCVVAPQAKLKLPAVAAFMPIYESALVIIDLITAVLLFGQYRILRSPALLLLGSGYLFSLLLTLGHALTFPGMFTPTGLLGAGPQSTAWIYMFWHSGFPLFVLTYALLKRSAPLPSPAYGRLAVALPLLVILLAAGLIALATAGQAALPAIMNGNQYTAAMRNTVGSVWLFSLVALLALARQRPYTVLDLWLMVVLSAWLFDIALSAMLNGGRYDLGFYAGRIFGLLACGVVLLELLLENGMLYARLVQVHQDEHRKGLELTAARDTAQAATAAKSMFLASMSHEIRTPMNAIIGLTHLVLETELQARQRDLLSKVQISSRALLTLLNDILDYSKIEAGKVVLEHEEFSPEETIENVGNLFSARIEESGLELFFEIGDDIPLRLCGDALRLTQVLNNLVGNAIKFTPRGEIVIGAELVSRSDTQIQIHFSVRDTGIGLPKAQAERLFRAFEQADSSITRRYGGTGLGLAICKRLVELMGGDIWVRSTPGEGSSFSFTANFEPARQAAECIDLHRIHGVRTLIVDSQPTARLILQQMLQSWRFQAGTASFTDDALLKLRRAERESPYELLLLDWRTAGIELVQEARRLAIEPGTRPPAVLIMAGAQQREQVLEAIGVEAAGIRIVLKPITPSRLFEAVVELQHGEAPSAPAPGLRESSFTELLQSLRGARVLLAEDNVVNQQVACAFLELAGLVVTVASNGEEAVDWVKRAAFDVVLMDMQMPDMDGIQATRVIRSLPQTARLPIIAMTAAAMDEDRQECLAAGMNSHVSKPIDPRQLAQTLLDWVHPQPGARQGAVGQP